MMLLPHAFLLPLVLAAALPAQAAADVWRCGSSYSTSPCAGGQPVAVDDSRSAEQRHEAREAVAQDRALARQLAAERREREAAWRAQGSGLMGIQAPRPGLPAAVKPRAASPHEARRSKKGPQKAADRSARRGTSPSADQATRPTRG